MTAIPDEKAFHVDSWESNRVQPMTYKMCAATYSRINIHGKALCAQYQDNTTEWRYRIMVPAATSNLDSTIKSA